MNNPVMCSSQRWFLYCTASEVAPNSQILSPSTKNVPVSDNLLVLLDFLSALHCPNEDVLLGNKTSRTLVIESIGEGGN